MKIFKNKISLINEISNKNNVAFVPTMGSIHKGHLSLIRRAKKESKNVLMNLLIYQDVQIKKLSTLLERRV